MDKTSGNIENTGKGKVEQRRINRHMTVIFHSFNQYYDIKPVNDITVVLPTSAGEKNFEVKKSKTY